MMSKIRVRLIYLPLRDAVGIWGDSGLLGYWRAGGSFEWMPGKGARVDVLACRRVLDRGRARKREGEIA